jgi:hypothetical protein
VGSLDVGDAELVYVAVEGIGGRFPPPDVTNAASFSGQSVPSRVGASAGDREVVPGGAKRAEEGT